MKTTYAAAFGAALAMCIPVPVDAQEWRPNRPVNIIVPWGAGGSTDQVTRVTAPILADQLGTNVVIVNQPGASGAIGTRSTLDAPRDGLTWTANALRINATYGIKGMIPDIDIDDWHLYLSVANVSLVSVPADSEFNDFGELLEALRTRGEEITVATAGVVSSGATAIAALADVDGFEYRMVTYDGGNPAAIATAGGEAMVTTQLAVEQIELVRGGRLRALAVVSDEPLLVAGVDPIPPVTDWVPITVAPDYFGIAIPRGVPDEVIATVDAIWRDHVMDSQALRDYAETYGAVFAPAYGDEARALLMPSVIVETCSSYSRGETVAPPASIGIDCETMSEIPRN